MSSNPTRSIRDPASLPEVLIAGASARAAAFSAVHGGLRVATADVFADSDLREIADATHVSSWPKGVLDWTRTFPSTVPFVYVGGLENAPELLTHISQERLVAGITGELLGHLRRPQFVADLCDRHEFPYPRLFPSEASRSNDLLVKPLQSVAGLGIRRNDERSLGLNEYLQEFITGISTSAAFLITSTDVELLDTFQQLPSEPSDSRSLSSFLYRGSITHEIPCRHRVAEFGAILHELGVRGLCGVDFIQSDDGELVVLEINPRYTASMELFEQRTGRSLILEHLEAFNRTTSPRGSRGAMPRLFEGQRGKRIVFARRPIHWRIPPFELLPPLPDGRRSFADIPREGARINADEPVCTLFVVGNTFDDCRRELLAREHRLLDYLESVARDD